LSQTGPNKSLQQTGHAIDGSSSLSAFSRVSRLLSCVVHRQHLQFSDTLPLA
jgi:hypothetical protein